MRFHKGSDGWGRDSYEIPEYAVAGSSNCGMYSDSPAPSDRVKHELDRLQLYLKTHHKIFSHVETTQSGNVFMVKNWVVVKSSDFERAVPIVVEWLEEHRSETRYIHDADLDEFVEPALNEGGEG